MTADVLALARDALRDRGIDVTLLGQSDCRVGGNNRVVRLDTSAGPFLAKLYFRDPDDPRDRLQTEEAFLRHAWGRGLPVPEPLASNVAAGLAVHAWVEGRHLAPGDLAADHVERAIAFFRLLNSPPRSDAARLPAASEACFTVAEHLALVGRRLRRLEGIPGGEPEMRDARDVVAGIARAWSRVRARVEDGARRLALPVDHPLPVGQRCVSPSDFGFHNALVRPSGEVVFVDFEYAGWDDPAKAVGDFFCQPQVPVARCHFEEVLAGFTAHAPDPEGLAARARLLFPVFQLKWCLIRLNEFTAEALRRRVFANPGLDVAARRRARIEDAWRALGEIDEAPQPSGSG